MSKNALRADLSRQMKTTKNINTRIPHKIIGKAAGTRYSAARCTMLSPSPRPPPSADEEEEAAPPISSSSSSSSSSANNNPLLALFLRTNADSVGCPRLDSSAWDYLTVRDLCRLRASSRTVYDSLEFVEYDRCRDGRGEHGMVVVLRHRAHPAGYAGRGSVIFLFASSRWGGWSETTHCYSRFS